MNEEQPDDDGDDDWQKKKMEEKKIQFVKVCEKKWNKKKLISMYK